ncbi:hypothetical protein DIPPA_30313, partial [Diplonema papillatum]
REILPPSEAQSGLCLYFDGGSRQNGTALAVAGAGAVVYEDGKKIAEVIVPLGRTTNNVAEFSALVGGLHLLGEQPPSVQGPVTVRGDSKVVISTMKKTAQCKPILRPYLLQATASMGALAPRFNFNLEHVARDRNTDADALSNAAMDQVQEQTSGEVSTVMAQYEAYRRTAISGLCLFGGQLVTAAYDGKLLIWDLKRRLGSPLVPSGVPAGEKGSIHSVLASGQLLTVGFRSGAVAVFVAPDKAALHSAHGAPPLRYCFALRCDPLRRRDVPTIPPAAPSRGLSAPAAGQAAGGSLPARLGQAQAPRLPGSRDSRRGHFASVTCMALCDDTTTFFTGGDDAFLIKWSLPHRRLEWARKEHCARLTALALASQTVLVAAAMDSSFTLWEVPNGMLLRCVHVDCGGISSLSLMPVHRRSSQAHKPASQQPAWPGLLTAADEHVLRTWELAISDE